MDFATLMDSQSGIVALGMAAVSGVCAFICAFMPAPTEQSGMLHVFSVSTLHTVHVPYSCASHSISCFSFILAYF